MGDEKDMPVSTETTAGQAPDDGGADGGILDPQALGTGDDEAATVAETGPGAGGD